MVAVAIAKRNQKSFVNVAFEEIYLMTTIKTTTTTFNESPHHRTHTHYTDCHLNHAIS